MFNVTFYENEINDDTPPLKIDKHNIYTLINGSGMFNWCSKITTFTSDLSSLTNGSWMFDYCKNLTTFNSDLSSLTNGYSMFNRCSKLTTFIGDLSSLTNGEYMFTGCTNLTTFTSDSSGSPVNLSSLINGERMFSDCSNLTSFTSDLRSLTYGGLMFRNCSNLTTFTSDLSSLINSTNMFNTCSNLTTFSSDLSSLRDSYCMFYSCSNLTTFTSDLSSLIVGDGMFLNCKKLTTFTSDLSSLTNGDRMFSGCKLDTLSLMYIAETIKDVRDLANDNYYICKKIHIGIGNTTPTEEETELLTEIYNKGWQVYVNGSSSSNGFTPTATTPIDGEEVTTPIPYWAKPQETDEEHAQYVGEDGKFYDILGGQFIYVDDPETYGLFTSLEDAAANMRLTPYVKPSHEEVVEEIETA